MLRNRMRAQKFVMHVRVSLFDATELRRFQNISNLANAVFSICFSTLSHVSLDIEYSSSSSSSPSFALLLILLLSPFFALACFRSLFLLFSSSSLRKNAFRALNLQRFFRQTRAFAAFKLSYSPLTSTFTYSLTSSVIAGTVVFAITPTPLCDIFSPINLTLCIFDQFGVFFTFSFNFSSLSSSGAIFLACRLRLSLRLFSSCSESLSSENSSEVFLCFVVLAPSSRCSSSSSSPPPPKGSQFRSYSRRRRFNARSTRHLSTLQPCASLFALVAIFSRCYFYYTYSSLIFCEERKRGVFCCIHHRVLVCVFEVVVFVRKKRKNV